MPTHGAHAVDWMLMRKCRARARTELLARGFDPLSKKLPEAIAKRARHHYSAAR